MKDNKSPRGTFEGLPVGESNVIMKISLNSELNQPTGKGVRIMAFADNRRITFDLTYDGFMEAMSGNFSVPAHGEVIKIERQT